MSTLTTTTTATTATVCVSLQPQSADHLLTDLFASYYSARSNKRNTASQMKFERRLSENMISLYEDVRGHTYTPGRSICFIIHDPVQREIFAASFRDRIIHHYLYNQLEPVFEPAFIYDSYSCRKGKGTLFGIERLEHHIRSCSENHHKECWVLKLDIKGYFMAIDRGILYGLIMHRLNRLVSESRLPDGFDIDTVQFLLHKVVFLDPTKGCRIKGSLSDWKRLPDSKSLFNAPPGCGLPIGNLTSQLFSNIYLNELDQFCKRELGFRHYGRYVDDFYLVDNSRERLEGAVPLIEDFLRTHLHLSLNARKTRIISCSCGVPFLGAVVCPNGRFLRSRTHRHLDRRWTETLRTESDPYVLLSVRNAREGFLKHFDGEI
ncbi:MAG: reverse transcriptase/maturase family protein [Bacteroidales bacterium]|nr:reverse transcriptase/maturase family protein [Bacteroidales bacterium]